MILSAIKRGNICEADCRILDELLHKFTSRRDGRSYTKSKRSILSFMRSTVHSEV